MLDRITPVVLTFNEEPNIGRVLGGLAWARNIVVVDSFSTDATEDIVRSFSNVRLFKRKFDGHAQQWNYAISQTGVSTEWVLALDADYVSDGAFADELSHLEPDPSINGYRASFLFGVWGKPLRGSLYPPVIVLYRKHLASYVQDGHTQRLTIPGQIGSLQTTLFHDDRKSLSHWLSAQDRYTRLEAEQISKADPSTLDFADRVRRLPLVAPLTVFISCYLLRFGFLDGRRGMYYALQRLLAESMLALRLLEARQQEDNKTRL